MSSHYSSIIPGTYQIQGKGIPEFMTNLVYRASSRTDSATEKPLFKANQQTNNKNIQKIVIKK